MTNDQKLQDYETKLELIKRHLDINHEYLTPIGFENELEKFVEKIDNAKKVEEKNNDLFNEICDLEAEIDDLEDEIKYLKNKLKEINLDILEFFKIHPIAEHSIKL